MCVSHYVYACTTQKLCAKDPQWLPLGMSTSSDCARVMFKSDPEPLLDAATSSGASLS